MSTLTEAAEKAQAIGDAATRLGGKAECRECGRLVEVVRGTIQSKHPEQTVYAMHGSPDLLRSVCRGADELVVLL
jgi:23S rRNA A2030 N6-methylase RlmJ